jgi:hypothetical protein
MGRIWRPLAGGRGIALLGCSAIVVGAINAAGHGPRETMQIGLLGAAAAIGVAYVFCDWPRRRGTGAGKSSWRFSA